MNIFIFKTNINSKKKIKAITSILDNHTHIKDWSVDTEDIDNVLRVVANSTLTENDVFAMIRICGFECEELPD